MPNRVKQEDDAPLPPRPKGWTAYMRAMGRKGGQASGAKRMTNLTPKQRSTIARKAAVARWNRVKAESK
jgi:hypothetical protein